MSRTIQEDLQQFINKLPPPTDYQRGFIEKVFVDSETGGMKGQKLAQFSQIPPDVLWELAEHFAKGAQKYPDDECTCAEIAEQNARTTPKHLPGCPGGKPNWQRGYSWRLSVDAASRHFSLWQQGQDFDPETGTSHLVAAMWHLMVLRWFEKNGKGKDFR